jgi:glucose-like phosphotransferase system IIB component
LEEAILALVGGKENILTLSDCMTRLRITVKDAAKLKVDELKALSGVMGVVNQPGEYQINLGPELPNLS